jgi:ubiquinone biosynthesis protein Coq4
MAGLGIRRFYISNLPLDRAAATLAEILERAGLGS